MLVVSKCVESLKDQAASVATSLEGVQSTLTQTSTNVNALVSTQNGSSVIFIFYLQETNRLYNLCFSAIRISG